MSIQKYSHKKHYKAIASWYHARDMVAPLPDALPTLGFVVDDKVAGWLYQTDSTIALVDGFISSPASLPSSRKQAVETLAAVLLDLATSLGYSTVLATTSHPTIKKIANKHNFKETSQTLYILNEDPNDTQDSDYEH
jgi:hypothetical protein